MVVWVLGDESDLECGGEEARVCGDVECVESGVLDGELGFGWTSGEDDDEDYGGDDWDGDSESDEGATEKVFVLKVVLAAVMSHCIRVGEVRRRF